MFRLMKILTLLLFMTFSLIGCSSTSVNSKSEASAVSEVEKQTKEVVKKTEVQDSSARKTTDKVAETNAALTKPNQTIEKVVENKTDTTKTEATQKDSSAGGTDTDTSTNKTTSTKEKPKTVSSATTVKQTSETKKQIVPKNTVFMTIKGPKDVGTILTKSAIEFKEGDTVLDVLINAAKEHHFQVEYSGSGAMAYIEGIDNIYEFDYGPTSGWNFKQNGTEMGKSSGTVKVKKDDQIEWVYTEDFTENK